MPGFLLIPQGKSTKGIEGNVLRGGKKWIQILSMHFPPSRMSRRAGEKLDVEFVKNVDIASAPLLGAVRGDVGLLGPFDGVILDWIDDTHGITITYVVEGIEFLQYRLGLNRLEEDKQTEHLVCKVGKFLPGGFMPTPFAQFTGWLGYLAEAPER
jgi:hypothetical protein